VWLYGNDPWDVERTILYGIRSGHPKSRNIADMPALVRTGQIAPDDARDAVEYLQSLAGRPYDKPAALRGRSIYFGKGNCYDCTPMTPRASPTTARRRCPDRRGSTAAIERSLYQSIVNGRHGMCPAWVDVLTPVQIRALALYLVATSALPRVSIVRH